MALPLRVKLILPALTEATSPYWRPIKYSLFPPLGLATLAAYLAPDDEAVIVDEHVQPLDTDDRPDLVVIQVYITNAYRAYRLADHYRAKGTFVALGGLHVTSLPDEALAARRRHLSGAGRADVPDSFWTSFRAGRARKIYRSTSGRTPAADPADPARSDQAAALPRSELHRRHARMSAALRLLLQGCVLHRRSIVLHAARRRRARRDFAAARTPSVFPGRPSARRPALRRALFDGMRGMNRLFQGAATVDSILRGDLIERAAEAGLRSIFVGFETLDAGQPGPQQQAPEPGARLQGRDRQAARPGHHDQRQLRLRDGRRRTGCFPAHRRLGHRAGDHDGDVPHSDAVSRNEAVRANGRRKAASSRATGTCYDTRHVVYRPARLTPEALKEGYDWAYREFYRWSAIGRAALAHGTAQASGEALLLRRRLEEVRASVGHGDSRQAASTHDAAARGRAVEAVARDAGFFLPKPARPRARPRCRRPGTARRYRVSRCAASSRRGAW